MVLGNSRCGHRSFARRWPLPDFLLLFPTAVDVPQIEWAAVLATDDFGIPAFRSVVTSLVAVSAGGRDIDRFSRGSKSWFRATFCLMASLGTFLGRGTCGSAGDALFGFPQGREIWRSDAFSVSIYPRLD